MVGKVSFDIDILVSGAELAPEIAARAKDMTVCLNNIVDEWVEGNAAKFNKGKGAENSGVSVDADVFWYPLFSESYQKSKRRAGHTDWLMVGTGQLKNTMSDPEAITRSVGPQEAVFGTPWAEEDELKIRGNWESRQVIFLGKSDQLAIKREVINYLSLGEDYREILFARGLETQRLKAAYEATFA